MIIDSVSWSCKRSYCSDYDIYQFTLDFEYTTESCMITGGLILDLDDRWEFDYVQATKIYDDQYYEENDDICYYTYASFWLSDDDDNPPEDAAYIEKDYYQFVERLDNLSQDERFQIVQKHAPEWVKYLKKLELERIRQEKAEKERKIRESKMANLTYFNIIKNPQAVLRLNELESEHYTDAEKNTITALLRKSGWYSVERVLVEFYRNFPELPNYLSCKKERLLERKNYIVAIAKSISQHGWMGSPLIKGHDNYLLTGAHRLAALKLAVNKYKFPIDTLVPIFDLYDRSNFEWILSQVPKKHRAYCDGTDYFSLKELGRHTDIGVLLGLDL